MTTFLISYDLANPSATKHELASAIMAVGDAWARPLDQTWYVRADATADSIEGYLKTAIGDDDGLIVHQVGDDTAMTNTALRWFRRRENDTAPAPSADVLPFPGRANDGASIAA